MRLIDECGPVLVTGRLGDIYALGQVVSERGKPGREGEGGKEEGGKWEGSGREKDGRITGR